MVRGGLFEDSEWGILKRGVWLLMVVTAGMVGVSTDWGSPPRYDGAGYVILAEGLGSGEGYRELDRPGRPRHAHFPPGFPVVLAGVFRAFGRGWWQAHLVSAAATVAAVGVMGAWFGTLYERRTAFLLGLALAVNWTWARIGGQIQSEPLFLLGQALAMWLGAVWLRKGGATRSAILGMVLAGCVLTRHVGIALVLAVVVAGLAKRRGREVLILGLFCGFAIAPWVVWLKVVGRGTQVGLIPTGGLMGLVESQLVFYGWRIPDQLSGPFVELATVFMSSRALAMAAGTLALLASALIVGGLFLTLESPRRRLAGLSALLTLAILLAWPFTEAGRFLVPVVPFLLVGATEVLASFRRFSKWDRRKARRAAALGLVVIALPYSTYSALSGRARAAGATHLGFDAACRWIKDQGTRPGVVMARHPGEVYLQTGRQAIDWGDSRSVEEMEAKILENQVTYLIVDDSRFANAPPSPLGAYAASRPGRARLVRDGEVKVFQIDMLNP